VIPAELGGLPGTGITDPGYSGEKKSEIF